MPTTEYLNGEDVTIEATFRKYPDWATSIVDHGAFLNQNSRYRNLLGVKIIRPLHGICKTMATQRHLTMPLH